VQLSERLSVPLSSSVQFSREVWELNAAFFGALSPAITVADCDAAFRTFAAYLGFTAKTPLADICEWHIAALS
jgi:hypothetical protein